MSGEVTTGLSAILSAVSTIVSSLLAVLTQFTGWILGDPLAIMFFAIMVIMLAVHLLHSLVHKFA